LLISALSLHFFVSTVLSREPVDARLLAAHVVDYGIFRMSRCHHVCPSLEVDIELCVEWFGLVDIRMDMELWVELFGQLIDVRRGCMLHCCCCIISPRHGGGGARGQLKMVRSCK